ncbi:hypothetical protein K2173_004929 [Erythroxylum novogranatense]|uniref:Amino acid transporter transmembrane domain-containing protein n=1 Tax=Erythroxylum novogranatense TaxID=1862640 RepID=A0AAV8TDF5_9ROSI|nr:hypothetical protein K2173_004929 [Erythroxylum novogranatense]
MTAARKVDEETGKVPLLADERGEDPEYEESLEAGAEKYLASSSSHGEQYTEAPKTAHQISKDSWFQVCIVLSTGVNCAYLMDYSETMMAHLGWIAGVVGIIAATALSFYANTLLAKLHEFGGEKHIRYRDLAGLIYGKKGYYTVWMLQYINLFMINVGLIILAGSAIKGVYDLLNDDDALKLPYCNIMAGLVCFLFAIMVPHLSALGVWLGLSAFLSTIYVVVAIVVSISDGVKAPPRDYSIPGTVVGKIFLTIEAVASCFVPFNTGMLPEIQATVRDPVVGNMLKALSMQSVVGSLPMYAVTFAGYWAYGSSTSSYLLNNLSGPVWAKALANIAAFFQAVIAFHIYACPSYEYLDTTYSVKENASKVQNLSFRIGLRGSYLTVSSIVAALLPFVGDFIGLIGSVCLIPLTFVIPHHMYMKARSKKLSSVQKLWHWLNALMFGVLSAAATLASVRRIVMDSKNYEIFG